MQPLRITELHSFFPIHFRTANPLCLFLRHPETSNPIFKPGPHLLLQRSSKTCIHTPSPNPSPTTLQLTMETRPLRSPHSPLVPLNQQLLQPLSLSPLSNLLTSQLLKVLSVPRALQQAHFTSAVFPYVQYVQTMSLATNSYGRNFRCKLWD